MKNDFENYIRRNLNGLDRKKPTPEVLERILDQMARKRNSGPGTVNIRVRLLKIAAACLILTACGIIFWYAKKQPPTMVAVKPVIIEKAPLQRPQTGSLTETGMTATDKTVTQKNPLLHETVAQGPTGLVGLYNRQSAATRLTTVAGTFRIKNQRKAVVSALVGILNHDPNSNVRLAALDELTRFWKLSAVRTKLAAALKTQQDPIVQMSLISLLTRMQVRGIIRDLEKIVNDENTIQDVRDYANSSILQLRS